MIKIFDIVLVNAILVAFIALSLHKTDFIV